MIDRAMSAATPRGGTARAFAFALLCLAASQASAASPALSPWTSQDLGAVAEAAMTAAVSQSDDGGMQASSLIQVGTALVIAGDTQRAKAMLLRAGALCGPPHGFMSTFARGDVVERLARLGDDADAEMVANVDADTPIRAALLGKLGKGRASAGNIAGAQGRRRCDRRASCVHGGVHGRACQCQGSRLGGCCHRSRCSRRDR